MDDQHYIYSQNVETEKLLQSYGYIGGGGGSETVLYANNKPLVIHQSLTSQIDANFRDLESQIQAGFDTIEAQRRENTIASLQSQLDAYNFESVQHQIQAACIENLFTKQAQNWNSVKYVAPPDASSEPDANEENDLETIKVKESIKNDILCVVIPFIVCVVLSVWFAILDPTPFINPWRITVFISRCVALAMLISSLVERMTK